MIVVSDTSPLHYLVLVQADHVLPILFGSVTIAEAVRDELSAPRTPISVRDWIRASPEWLHVQQGQPIPADVIPSLHAGERATIFLAMHVHADLVLLDEREGRATASGQGLRVTGTLGVLNAAGRSGLVTVPRVIEKLRETSFYASDELFEWLLEQYRDK